jgi:predicted nucleic acid-binding Zn ribbon protein
MTFAFSGNPFEEGFRSMTLKVRAGIIDAGHKRNRRVWLARFLIVLLTALVLFESFSLVCWSLIPFFPQVFNPHTEGLVSAALNSEAWLFYLPAALASIFVVLMMFSWMPRLFAWLDEGQQDFFVSKHV